VRKEKVIWIVEVGSSQRYEIIRREKVHDKFFKEIH